MIEIITKSFRESLEISLYILLMMVVLDLINIRSRGTLLNIIQKKAWRPYVFTSMLGVVPGCLGGFMSVSMYIHGFIGIGALTTALIVSSGDAALVMLVKFPYAALFLFFCLIIIGLLAGGLIQWIITRLKLPIQTECQLQEIHEDERSVKHYFFDHIWHHIVKRHLFRIFIWMLVTFLFLNFAFHFWDVNLFVRENMLWALFLASLIGLIPDSGPQFIFVFLFADSVIPFSVLLANTISQEGHGILPLVSYSIRDASLIKLYKFILSIIIGGSVYLFGL